MNSSSASHVKETWSVLEPCLAPPIAASIAIIPASYDMVAKSALQKGLTVPRMTVKSFFQGVKSGFGAAPTAGLMIGTQMVLQVRVKEALLNTFPNLGPNSSNQNQAALTLSSAIVTGGLISPVLAVYNGKTMTPAWSVQKSLSKFSLKQGGAITLQQTGIVAGLAAADLTFTPMKQVMGDSKVVEYSAAAIAGAIGSLFGHFANTALTRWQNDLKIERFSQLNWGIFHRTRGNALIAVIYKFVKTTLDSTV